MLDGNRLLGSRDNGDDDENNAKMPASSTSVLLSRPANETRGITGLSGIIARGAESKRAAGASCHTGSRYPANVTAMVSVDNIRAATSPTASFQHQQEQMLGQQQLFLAQHRTDNTTTGLGELKRFGSMEELYHQDIPSPLSLTPLNKSQGHSDSSSFLSRPFHSPSQSLIGNAMAAGNDGDTDPLCQKLVPMGIQEHPSGDTTNKKVSACADHWYFSKRKGNDGDDGNDGNDGDPL